MDWHERQKTWYDTRNSLPPDDDERAGSSVFSSMGGIGSRRNESLNRGVDRQHVSAESTSEQEKHHLEYHRETPDEEVQWPLSSPSQFRWRSPQRSIRRFACIGQVVVAISLAGSSRTSRTASVSPGMADWLRVRKMARTRAADYSLGSGWRFEWTSTTEAGL